jgi:metal-responsive CopG/Arc/MetJ family transcriptional regulator
MRKTSLVTISLPPAMVKESTELANTYQMTRSEFLRAAIRNYTEELKKQAKKTAWEEKHLSKIVARFEKAKKAGKLKTLQPGDLERWAAES